MKLFYSGAKDLNGSQFTPSKSLGGYISSTVIPNGKVESVFSNYSNRSINENLTETKGIFLKNVFPAPVKNVLVYCVYPPESTVRVELAAIAGNQLELLRSAYDTPYYAEFHDVSVVFSYTDILVTGPFLAGETVVIEGVSIAVPNGLITEFFTNAIKAFKTSLIYEAIQIDDSTLRLQYRVTGVYTNLPVVTSHYIDAFTFSAFDHGIDNSQLIADTINPGDSIGIWLKRIQNDTMANRDNAAYYKKLYDEFVANNYNIIQNNTLENIKFCIEWD